MKRALDTNGNDSTATLQTFLASGAPAVIVELYKFVFPWGTSGSTVLGYTDADVDIAFGDVVPFVGPVLTTYRALATRPLRSRLKMAIGTEVDELDVTLAPWIFPARPSTKEVDIDVIPGSTITIPAAAASGLFDGVYFELRRLHMAQPPQWGVVPDLSNGAVMMFAGSVGDVDADRLSVRMTIRSPMDMLRIPFPRSVFQASCLNTLYDTVCALSPTGVSAGIKWVKSNGGYTAVPSDLAGTAFQATTTINGPASTTMLLYFNASPAQPDGWFDLGYVALNAGPFKGLRRPIKFYSRTNGGGGAIALAQPMPFTLDDGQAVQIGRAHV